jgi:hypothetical protein
MAAPAGNKYALGNTGGSPAFYKSPAEMAAKIEEYFASASPQVVDQGDDSEHPEPRISQTITITGLALFLGFESRQSFYDYEKREEFSYLIKRARLVVENAYEENLHYKNPTGSIFALKNMGWDDRQHIKHEGIPPQNVTYQVVKPDEE